MKITPQIALDHEVMNSIRQCKGGERFLISKGDMEIVLKVSVRNKSSKYSGEQCRFIAIDKYASL